MYVVQKNSKKDLLMWYFVGRTVCQVHCGSKKVEHKGDPSFDASLCSSVGGV